MAFPSFNVAIVRKNSMTDLLDTLLFKAGEGLVGLKYENNFSMSCCVLGKLANTTFNRYQEHCPSLALDADHIDMQSATVYKSVPFPASAH